MVGLIILLALFLLHALVIIIEKRMKCWKEQKLWVSLFFVLVLLSLSLYGFSWTLAVYAAFS